MATRQRVSFILLAIAVATSGASSLQQLIPDRYNTNNAHTAALARLDDFVSRLTSVLEGHVDARNGALVRVVHSSGGAAGGVISESQGYGLLLAGSMAAALGPAHPRRTSLVELALECGPRPR